MDKWCRHSGLMASVLTSGLSSVGYGPSWGHRVVFFGKTLFSQYLSTQVYKWVMVISPLEVTL